MSIWKLRILKPLSEQQSLFFQPCTDARECGSLLAEAQSTISSTEWLSSGKKRRSFIDDDMKIIYCTATVKQPASLKLQLWPCAVFSSLGNCLLKHSEHMDCFVIPREADPNVRESRIIDYFFMESRTIINKTCAKCLFHVLFGATADSGSLIGVITVPTLKGAISCFL